MVVAEIMVVVVLVSGGSTSGYCTLFLKFG